MQNISSFEEKEKADSKYVPASFKYWCICSKALKLIRNFVSWLQLAFKKMGIH